MGDGARPASESTVYWRSALSLEYANAHQCVCVCVCWLTIYTGDPADSLVERTVFQALTACSCGRRVFTCAVARCEAAAAAATVTAAAAVLIVCVCVSSGWACIYVCVLVNLSAHARWSVYIRYAEPCKVECDVI